METYLCCIAFFPKEISCVQGSAQSRIIRVKSAADETKRKITPESTIHPSDSQDSGCTIPNGDAERDGDSLISVKSRDSAVQSMTTEKMEDKNIPSANDSQGKTSLTLFYKSQNHLSFKNCSLLKNPQIRSQRYSKNQHF